MHDTKSSANQSVVNCTAEPSEVTPITHLDHHFIIAWILLYLCSFNQKTLAELESSQYPN